MELSPQSAMDLSSPSAVDGSESEQSQSNNNNGNGTFIHHLINHFNLFINKFFL